MIRSISTAKGFLIFWIFFSILTISLSITIFTQNYYGAKQTIEKRLKYQSERIENSLTDAFNYTEHTMRYMQKQIIAHGEIDYNFIKKLLASYKIQDNRIAELSTFAWANEKHRYIISSNSGFHFDKVLDLSKRDYIPKTVSDPFRIHLGKPVFGIYSQKYSIPAGYGVVENGKYLGAFIIGFVTDGLQRKLDEIISSEGISFVLIQKDGTFITSSSNIKYKKLQSFLKNKLNNKNRKQGLLHDIKLFNDKAEYGSIYYNDLNRHKYRILTIYDKDLEKKEIYNIFQKHIIIFSLLLIIVSILLLIFYQNLIKPIIELSKHAKEISKGNHLVAINNYNNSELSQLTNALLLIKNFVQKEKSLKQALEKSIQAQTKLIQATSHDLKNYIFGISGMARMIIENKTKAQINKNEDLKLTKDICEQSEELMHFVEDLLDTNQTETGEFSIKKLEYCDIGDLIERMILLNKNMAVQHKIEFKTDIEKNLPELKCDKRRFKQILTNLITNAIKYSPKDTQVVISAKTATKEISRESSEEKGSKKNNKKFLISIKDQGIGMTDEEIKKALSGSGEGIDKSELNKEIDSHGIGLPNVKQLVELHKGILEIESAKGQGSTVNIYFDIPQRSKTQQNLINTKAKKTNKDKSILVVDDTPINIKVISRILRNAGYFVKHTQNGQEALKALDQIHFDLILMDGEMPIMDGYKATKEIRKGKIFKNFKNYKKIPIIAFMGNNDKETLRKVTEAGMNSHIDKGTTPKEILDVVGSYNI